MNAEMNQMRPRLMAIAYRILRSVADAEDAVQSAFLRLQLTADVTSPEGFLVRATTRLCIDQLRSDVRRRQCFAFRISVKVDIGAGADGRGFLDGLTQAFQLMLERLSADERAAFLLRTVFDYEYFQIANVLGKSEAHARQIVSRAKSRMEQDRLRFRAAPDAADNLAERFLDACRAGDVQLVERLFADDAKVSLKERSTLATRVAFQKTHRADRTAPDAFRKVRKLCSVATT